MNNPKQINDLIVKQVLKIDELETYKKEAMDGFQRIHRSCIAIGAPLNDNIKGYTKDQREDFHYINNIAEQFC